MEGIEGEARTDIVCPNPVLPIHFKRDGTSLRLFTTIATLGTARDVTLEEIRIEFFFPMDEPSAQAFKRWSKR